MPRRNQTYIETPVGSSRRRHRSGRLLLRTTLATGRQSYYGSWYCGRRRVKRCVGPARRRGDRNGGLTEQQAEAKLRDMIAASASETAEPQVTDRLDVSEVGAHYVRNAARKGRKKGTLQDIESDVRVHLAPFFKDKPLDAITYEDVDDLVAVLERKGLAPKTIRDHIATLSALFNFAMAPKRRWAITNPCVGVELPAVPEREEIRFLTLDEVVQLLDHVQPGMYADTDREMLLAAIMTGMRKGEIVALRWRDIDWTANRIRVRKNFSRGETVTPKSRRGRRSIPMTGELAAALRALQDRSRRRRPDDLVFGHPETGEEQPKANMTRRLRVYLRAAGLDDTHTFHDLRHTFGTLMAAAGVPMRTLQEWMGHRDITTTQKYADYAPSPHEGEMVDAAFAREQPTPPARPRLALVGASRRDELARKYEHGAVLLPSAST